MSGELLDTPNQQVVRADGSSAWDEGTGGGKPSPKSKAKAAPAEPPPGEATSEDAPDEAT